MTIALDGATVRTPEQHRRVVARCGGYDAPPAASPRPSRRPRHRALVHDLAGLRMWVDLQSSAGVWLQADNDNTPAELRGPGEQRQLEAERDIVPSVDQMVAATAGAEPVRDGHRVTLGGLRFDHGRLTAWRDDAGTWRRPAEIQAPRRASQAGATGSDAAVGLWMAVQGDWPTQTHQRPIHVPQPGWPLRSARRDWIDIASPSPVVVGAWTRPAQRPADVRDWLMVASEPVPVTRCPSPAQPTLGRLAEQFLTGRCRPSGAAMPGGPDLGPQEATAIRQAEEDAAARLPRHDRQVLAKAATARSMKDIGTAAGFRGKKSERKGPEALIIAAKNLREILLAA